MIIPSIDISGGRAVQLRQGREHLLTSPREPADLAAEFARYGPVAVVDLDAARGQGSNRDAVAACCRVAPCRVGGGIRTAEQVRDWIKAGAEQVVIGTAATPEFLKQFPPQWLIVAVDARGQEVVDHGWTRGTGRSVPDAVRKTSPFCGGFLFTQVQVEGCLEGPDLDTARRLLEVTDRSITVAGGIRNADDIRALEELGMNAQIGRAVYEGSLDLVEAFVAQVRFSADGLVPTVVQSAAARDVLMVAYSNADSLRAALREGRGWYYSRSRRALWRKGDTSGHTQKLLRARWDCDRDTLLFAVEQTGPACHTNADTCFGPAGRDVLRSLAGTLAARRAEMAGDEPRSYTQKLLADPDRLAGKLREEIEEVIAAPDLENLVWECGDVLYHLLVRMTAAGVSVDEVLDELRSRFRP
jgi:phosphoribosyl-ATP pyrophosphohydrolase/phosphoribosyl-AMP cyclohydrolase